MRRLRKGLTWLSVIVFFLGVGIFYTQETKAAVAQDGSPDHPFVTNDRSIERYFFDKYKNKSEIASAWSKYQSYAKSNDDAPWYIRLGDTSKLSAGKIALNSDDTNLKLQDEKYATPLYVCWVSKLKRASSSKHGTYEECAINSTGKVKTEDVGGSITFYNTFGYGIRGSKYENWRGASSSASLGQDSNAFVWYDDVKYSTDHKRLIATKNSSGKINSFWMYTNGGDVGYVVYYVKYKNLYEFLDKYNQLTANGNQLEPTQQDDSSKDAMGQKYARYDIYLNGSIALHNAGSGWDNNSKTWKQNETYFSTFGDSYLTSYADQNYNRHIKLHVLNGVPIVVRAWDITTNQIVSQTVGSSTDYYLQAFDSELADVRNSDGVYWDVNSEVHTTDIQHALIKFLYKDVKTENGKKTNCARVAYDIDGYKYKSMQIDNYVRKKNAEANASSAGDDGLAVLYLPKLSGMTSSDKAQTADAYAPVGIRVFAVGGEDYKLASLRKKNYSQLRNYDPATEGEAEENNFSYKGNVVNYCYDIPKIDVGGEKIRALNFDIRHDVRTADGVLSYKTRMEWPTKKMYDGSKDGHTNENVIACKFFSRYALSTKVNRLQNKKLWRTMDGTRYVYVGQKSAGKDAREYLENGKVALASIKEVAQGLGAKYSDFTMRNSKTLNVEDPSCIVIDVLVSEMYYDQAKYNIEQLSVIDNKYDDEHGVWGYTGSGSTVVGTIEAADGAEADDTRSIPDVVHSEADDSKSGNTVSMLDSFRKKSDNYLRLDIDTYGKKVNTNKNADGSSHSDGTVYTLEGWSHYVSPSNNKVNATNAGYMDSLDSSFDDLKIDENKFALYSSEWYKRMDAFGDKDDDPNDGKISAKLAKQKSLLVDAWTYNLFYVIKPPIIGIVYVYNEDTNTYDVKYVSARSCKTFGTSNLTKARKKAADNQLKSKGVKGKNAQGEDTYFILYDAGYHRAGDRVTVTVCGSYQYKVTTELEIAGYTTNKYGIPVPYYTVVMKVDGIDLAGVYATNAKVDFYDDENSFPAVGSSSVEVDSKDPWGSACLFNYYGRDVEAARNTGVATYHWRRGGGYTKKPEPRADVTFDFTMPEQTTAIVAVYGGTANTAPMKKTFKMRVQYLEYDGTTYKEINTETIMETGTGDKLTVTPKIDVGKSTILDIGYKKFKQNDVQLSRKYIKKPDATWGQKKDQSYTLYPDENKDVVYVVINGEPNAKKWVTVVYLDAGNQELPPEGESTTFNYEYSYAEQYEGKDQALVGLNGKDVDWVGIAYGPDLPKYDQVVDVDGVPTLKNPKPDMNEGTAWSLNFQARVSRRDDKGIFDKPTVSKDAAGRSITWEKKGRMFYDVGGGEGRGCVIYVLSSQQWVPAVPWDRTTVTKTETVEKLDEHKVDWVKASLTPVDGSGNLSAGDYSTLGVSADNANMRVMLANDEVNSTRAAYNPLLSIPTSELIKQYARIKKYECEWQYEKVTITWTFTDITRTRHVPQGAHYCPGHSGKNGPWSHACHCVHTCGGAPINVDTVTTTTRYTTFYRVVYGDTYVPKDVTTFNESFGTFGTKVYNKTLDKFGHATMLVKNNAYQNDSLGYHKLSNADVSYPDFDKSKLFSWDLSPHHTCVAAHWGPHASYLSSSRENKAACQERLELAVGKSQLYKSANEEWIFGDGEGNFTQLSNHDLNHDNELARNIIEAPPDAGYTVSEGITTGYDGTPDKLTTYSEGCSYATGRSADQFYQNAIPVPVNTLNDSYDSKAYVHWQLHSQAKEHKTDNDKIMRIEADGDVIFTPTVNLDTAIVDNTAVQKIDQNGNMNFTMDDVFRLRIEATGVNSNEMNYPGYGYDNYDRFLNKDIVDDKLEHVGYVKFPFPVIKKALVNGETIDTYYKEYTWIACKMGETEFIPAYFKDEIEDVQIQFMNRAENVLEKTSFTYEAPGTAMSQIHDADNVEDLVRSELMNGSIPDWDRIAVPTTNGSAVDSDGVHTAYIATGILDCNLYGRVYGFAVIDQTDYPDWQGTFRNSDGTLSMTKYLSGVKNRDGWLVETDTLKTFPTVKGSNKQFVNAGVLKPGYAIRYTFETVGNAFGNNDYVEITPKFYWVDQDGKKRGAVDVYYKEKSSANAIASLIRVGSDADKRNKKVLNLDSFGFDHDYNYYTEVTSPGTGTGNVKNESGNADPTGGQLKYSLLQDTQKDNLVHASEILKYDSVKSYLGYSEELWCPSFTKLINKMQTYDGLRHSTILSNGVNDQFSALKSAVALNSETLGVSREDIYKRIQEWYGEFYLPSDIYVTDAGTDVAAALKSGVSGSELTGDESIWKHDGYLAVKFDIVTYRNGERWLTYDNNSYVDGIIAYDRSDMWSREAYVTSKKDTSGTTFDLTEGTTVLYQVGYPGGSGTPTDRTHHTNPSAANDYEGAGTH